MADIASYIGHDQEGKPLLVLHRKHHPDGPKGYIPLREAWRFSEDHNPDFERQIMSTAMAAHDHLLGNEAHLYPSKRSMARKMAELATIIENSLDDLINAPPVDPNPGRVIGEAKAVINDQDIRFEYTDKGMIHHG